MSDSLTKEARAAEAAGRKRGVAEIVAVLEEPAPGLVAEVVRRTRLRRGEKRRVAAELVGHFEDGVAGGETLEGLVKRFGEPIVVARLIRRAQRRQRGMWWKTWNVSWKGVVCLLVLYVAAGLYLATGRAVVEVDYGAKLLAKAAAVPEGDGAWPFYREALVGLGALPEYRDAEGELTYFHDVRLGDEHWDEVVVYLEEHSREFDLMREGAGMAGLGLNPRRLSEVDRERWGIDGTDDAMAVEPLISLLLPHLSDVRVLARLLSVDMYRAAELGDGVRVVDDVAAMLGMAGHVREIPILIDDLVGLAVESLAFDELRVVLRENGEVFDEAQLLRAAHLLAGLDGRFTFRTDGERMSFYDVVQRLYTPGEDGYLAGDMKAMSALELDAGGSMVLGEDQGTVMGAVARVGALPALKLAMASRGEVVAEYDRMMGAVEAMSSRPMWEWSWDSDDVLEELMEGWGQWRYFPIQMLMPSLERAAAVLRWGQTERDGVLVAIALELYRRGTVLGR